MLDALSLAIPLICVGAGLVAIGIVSAREKLPPGGAVGIRLPSITANEAVWDFAHKKASVWMTLAGIGPVVAAVGMLFMRHLHEIWAIFSVSWLVLFLIIATVVALRAASRFQKAAEATEAPGHT